MKGYTKYHISVSWNIVRQYKGNDVLTLATTWTELKNIILGERSQQQKTS